MIFQNYTASLSLLQLLNRSDSDRPRLLSLQFQYHRFRCYENKTPAEIACEQAPGEAFSQIANVCVQNLDAKRCNQFNDITRKSLEAGAKKK